jgi:hypothetical protein
MASVDDVHNLLNAVNTVTLKRMEEKTDAINAVTLKRMETREERIESMLFETLEQLKPIQDKLGIPRPGGPGGPPPS